MGLLNCYCFARPLFPVLHELRVDRLIKFPRGIIGDVQQGSGFIREGGVTANHKENDRDQNLAFAMHFVRAYPNHSKFKLQTSCRKFPDLLLLWRCFTMPGSERSSSTAMKL